MKKLLLLMAFAPLFFACGEKAPEVKVYEVLTLLPEADTLVGKEITIQGRVKHVCSHTAMKCFLEAEGSPETILVKSGGEFEKFDPEVVGLKIEVVGVLREQRLEESKIQEKEEALKEKVEKAETEEEVEHCDTEQNNVDAMRKWMKDNNKDYYAIYFIEGIRYKVIETEE